MDNTQTPAPTAAPKKSKGSTIVTIICILLAVGGISFGTTMAILGLNKSDNGSTNNGGNVIVANDAVDFGSYRIEKYKGEPYYIYQKDYTGEYDIQLLNLLSYPDDKDDDEYYRTDRTRNTVILPTAFRKSEVMSFDEYKDFCKKWNLTQKYTKQDAEQIAVISNYFYGSPIVEAKLAEAQEEGNYFWLYYYDHSDGVTADIGGYAIFVPVSYYADKVVPVPLYSEEEFTKIKHPELYDPGDVTVKKPIIYLYPEAETEVKVSLGKPENLTVSYPHYSDSWNVVAKPNGDLIDTKTGRKLYALYYESEAVTEFKVSNEGFVVKGSDAAAFLEEKLALLGLNEREAEEFIVYWLPVLEANNYNYIRFESAEVINGNMPLTVSPTPDNMIRVWMTFKGLEAPIEVTEQKLETPARNGFTVVEWGATEIE